MERRLLGLGSVTNDIKLLSKIVFRFSPKDAEAKITVMIKADGTDSRHVSSRPTS